MQCTHRSRRGRYTLLMLVFHSESHNRAAYDIHPLYFVFEKWYHVSRTELPYWGAYLTRATNHRSSSCMRWPMMNSRAIRSQAFGREINASRTKVHALNKRTIPSRRTLLPRARMTMPLRKVKQARDLDGRFLAYESRDSYRHASVLLWSRWRPPSRSFGLARRWPDLQHFGLSSCAKKNKKINQTHLFDRKFVDRPKKCIVLPEVTSHWASRHLLLENSIFKSDVSSSREYLTSDLKISFLRPEVTCFRPWDCI